MTRTDSKADSCARVALGVLALALTVGGATAGLDAAAVETA